MSDLDGLFQAARAAQDKAYAPYSRFKVGAAIASVDGRIFAGCNVENAAYPVGSCAEAGAISAMVAAGGSRIAAIVVDRRWRTSGDAMRRVPAAHPGICRPRYHDSRSGTCRHPAQLHARRIASAFLRPGQPDRTIEMIMEHKITETAAYLRERGISGPFEAAFVLGTGLGTLVEEVSNQTSLSYNEIPHFPQSGVSGHAGKLVAGTLEGKRVLLLQGRAHYYETGDAGAMRIPVGVIASLDIPVLILTNAAGSVRADIRPGSLVSISDHINLAGANPLMGDTTERRFVSMTGAYDVGCAKCYSAPPQERGSQCRRVFIRGFRDPVSKRRPRLR